MIFVTVGSRNYPFDRLFKKLDELYEREILKGIFYLLKGKTIIFISHSLKNKRLFDRSIYLKSGKCYEEKV